MLKVAQLKLSILDSTAPLLLALLLKTFRMKRRTCKEKRIRSAKPALRVEM